MEANVGSVDRGVRVVIGVALLSLVFVLKGTLDGLALSVSYL